MINQANGSDTEAPFLEFYDKRDDFDFDIVNFPFLDWEVPSSTSYGCYGR